MEETIKMLKKRLYVAIWAFYDHHRGTVMHLDAKERIYRLIDKLKNLGVTQVELEKLETSAKEGGHYAELL